MKHPMRTLRTVALAVTVAFAATACGGDGDSGSQGADGSDDYKILMITANSGPFQVYGEQTRNAVEITAEELNASGGINGRKVVVEVVDDQGDATKAVSLLQEKLADGDRPDAVYAGTTSNEALALLPLLTREKIINIGVTGAEAINDPEKFPYTFRVNHAYSEYTPYVAEQLRAKGYRKVGVFYASDALGRSSATEMNEVIKDAGIETVDITFDPTGLDLSAPISQLKAAGVEAVVFGVVAGSTAGQLLQARVKAGFTEVPFIADQTTNADMASLVGAAGTRNVFAHQLNACLTDPEVAHSPRLATFIEEMAKRAPIKNSLIAPVMSADIVRALAVAAEQAGSTDPDELKEAFESLAEQPAGTWLSFQQVRFSPEDHFNNAAEASDYSLSTYGPMIEGQISPQQ